MPEGRQHFFLFFPIFFVPGSPRLLDRKVGGIADVHRGDGKRFAVRADEKPTAFVELGLAIRVLGHGLHEN